MMVVWSTTDASLSVRSASVPLHLAGFFDTRRDELADARSWGFGHDVRRPFRRFRVTSEQ